MARIILVIGLVLLAATGIVMGGIWLFSNHPIATTLIVLFAVAIRFIGRRILAIRYVLSPPANNWIFLGLCFASTVLFFNAVYQEWGEPLGIQAVSKFASQPPAEDALTKYYYDSARYFINGTETPLPQVLPKIPEATWFWWHVWFFSFVVVIIYFPLAFWDELVSSWRRARESVLQRHREYDLEQHDHTPAPEQNDTQPRDIPRNIAHTFWQRMVERFTAALSADMVWEFAENAFGSAFRAIAGRNR